MTEEPIKNSIIMWQTQEDSLPEPAILIESYSDTISVQQMDQSILLNRESLEEFIKTLRRASKLDKK